MQEDAHSMTDEPVIPVETAPSPVRDDMPSFARWVGVLGWSLIIAGAVVVSFNIYVKPAVLSEESGWMFMLLGTILSHLHAAVENDGLARRWVGVAGVVAMVGGLIWGAAFASQGKNWGVGVIPFLPGMFLLALFARREEDEFWKNLAVYAFGLIAVVSAILGVLFVGLARAWSENLGYVLLLVAILALPLYFGLSRLDDGRTYYSGLGVAIFGGVLLVTVVAVASIPQLLYEWRSPVPKYAMPTALTGAALLAIGVLAWLVVPRTIAKDQSRDSNAAIRSAGRIAVLAGAALAVVGGARLAATDILRGAEWFSTPPRQFIIPYGVVLGFVALYCLGFGAAHSSENRLVVLVRREITAIFMSPIAYVLLAGYACMAVVSFNTFLGDVLRAAELSRPLEEPFVLRYFIGFLPFFGLIVAVPLLTMRMFSEERRTGSLEVLMTAPVTEWHVVLSKFIAGWVFFLLLWAPWFLCLLTLRLEADKPFDFHPLIGFVLALAITGAGFVAMGMFFSSLTSNQIIAAVLTLLALLIMIALYFVTGEMDREAGFWKQVGDVMQALSFVDMWIETWQGKLWLPNIAVHASLATFWLFLTTKVLESRRWS